MVKEKDWSSSPCPKGSFCCRSEAVSQPRPFLLPCLALFALLFTPLEQPLWGPSSAQAEVRGKSFEVAGIVGGAGWQRKTGLRPCVWFGGMAGHRFEAVADRIHVGFRATWEGCITALDTETRPRVDMILVGGHFNYGIKPVDWMLVYAQVGAGMMLGDRTPSGGTLTPRLSFSGGPGVFVSLGKYLFLDVSFRLLVFENFQFGSFGGQAGGTVNPLGSLIIGAQI